MEIITNGLPNDDLPYTEKNIKEFLENKLNESISYRRHTWS